MRTLANYDQLLENTETHDLSHALILPEARALPAQKKKQVNFDINQATTSVIARYEKLLTVRPAIVKEFNSFDIAPLDKLAHYARALNKANAIYNAACTAPSEVTELAADAATTGEILLTDTKGLILRGLLQPEVTKELKKPVGYENLASNLNLLTTILDGCSEMAERPCTAKELLRAKKLMARLKFVVGYRDMNKDQINEAADLRDRFFTLFIEAYSQVLRALSYLYWDTDKGESFAPSLYPRSKHSSADSEESVPEETSTSEPAVVTPSVPRSPNSPSDNPFLV